MKLSQVSRQGILIAVLSGLFFAVKGQEPYRVSVTDFGAVANSKADATPAIRKAIEACRGKKSAVLLFPKGRYDLFAGSAVRKEYFISNTSSETECPSKIKTIGILLEGMKNLRIEGEGSLLVFHGKMITFALDHCTNVRVHNLEMDFERPTMSEFSITRSTPGEVDVSVHRDSWYRVDSGRLSWYGEDGRSSKDEPYFCIRIDTGTRAMYYANDEYAKLAGSEVTEQGAFRLRFRGSFDTARYLRGNVFTERNPVRDEVGAFIVLSKNIVLQNVQMHYMHGLGIVSQ